MVCTVTRLKYAALVGLSSGRPRKKGLVQTAREIPGNLFQITWTGVRSDGLMGAICFIAVEKRPEYGQWDRMVPANTSCVSLRSCLRPFRPTVVPASGIANRNNKRLACIFSSFAQFPAHGSIIAQRKQKQANEERIETLTSVILFPPLKVFAHISSAIFPSRSCFLLSLAPTVVFLSDELITRSRQSLAQLHDTLSWRNVVV